MGTFARTASRVGGLLVIAFGTTAIMASTVRAQVFHGVTVQKGCIGPIAVDPMGLGIARRGDQITCTIRVTNADEAGHTIRVNSIVDVVHHVSGDATFNLLPAPITLVGLGTSFDASHTDTVEATDTDPLVDTATADGVDLGDSGTGTDPVAGMFQAGVHVIECIADTECNDQNACTDDTCVQGICVHTSDTTRVCRPAAGACDVAELCDANGNCPADAFSPSTTVCRASAGVCDVAENCTGSSANCPPDNFSPSTTVCRAATGPCDVAENCTGNSATCPTDVFSPTSVVCRPSAGPCDAPENCSGTSGACPADAFAGTAVVCRPSNGPCDAPENCPGNSASCPTDVFQPSSTVCRPSAGPCDAAENCPGNGAQCPTDTFQPSSTVCRPSAGVCDTPESCTGSSAACPADAFQPSSTVCRPSAGDCDVAENCTGSTATCPADGFQPTSTVCRASAGPCDVAENCPGNGPSCPTNTFQPSTTVCRASTGVCDAAENCPGNAAACPPDVFAPSSTVCRPSAGPCDVPENCTGSSGTCPADGFQPSTTVCRAAAGDCDLPENCTGSTAACPADAFKPSSTVCRASAGPCDVAENCPGNGANCPADGFSPSSTVCRPAAGPCDVPENCSGAGAACPADAFSPTSTVCRAAAGDCDLPENCTGTGASCPTDAFKSSATVCRPSAGPCDVPENCPGNGAACPANAFSPSSTVCRASAGVCDVAENCPGNSANCPADGFQPTSTVCRPTGGVCDVPENCPGNAATCPGDSKQPPGTTCRAPDALCDRVCDGNSNDCPAECPDAGVLLSTSTPNITAGDTAKFDFTVQGNGPGTSTGVVMTAPLPAGLTWTLSGANSGQCSVSAANLLTCNFGSVPQGTMKQVTASAVTGVANCGSIQTTATIVADIDTNAANNTSGPVPITINCADVGVVLTTPTPAINAGDTAVYNIVVTANGPGSSSNVVLMDQLPTGLTWVLGGPDSGSCSIDASNKLTCNFGTMTPGSSKQVTVSAVTTTANCGTIQDTATVTAAIDTNPDNNSSGPVAIVIACSGGCRMTGGGHINSDGTTDGTFADSTMAHFGGQVGAPCGCIGCFDEFGHIQGNFQYDRKKQKSSLHAKNYNSLVCTLDGGPGPNPPAAPANKVCFSGVADFSGTPGKKTTLVAFRVDAEDRGEPGNNDRLRMRVWIPTGNETPDALAAQACCTNVTPDVRTPDIDDDNQLVGGNIQIHPALKKSIDGVCPVPHGMCFAR